MPNTPQNQPEAQETRERVTQQAGEKIKSSIFDRLVDQETDESKSTRRKHASLRGALTSIVKNENLSVADRRRAFSKYYQDYLKSNSDSEKELKDEDMYEPYGHMVLDHLEKTLEEKRIKGLKTDFERERGNIIPPERAQLVEKIITHGFVIPRGRDAAERINKEHRYIYVKDGTLRMRSDIIQNDIKALDGNTDEEGKTLVDPTGIVIRCKTILTELLEADPLSTIQVMPFEQRGRTIYEQKALDALRKIFGILALALAAFSLAIEKNKQFPTFTIFYAGLAALAFNPKLLSGRMSTLRGQLEFVHSSTWDNLIQEHRAELTGTSGADFFTEMTENSTARMLYIKMRDKKNKKKKIMDVPETERKKFMEEYHKELQTSGVPEKHVAFLRGLAAENPLQWEFLLLSVARVQSTEARTLLIGFARQGMTMDSLKDLPTKPAQASAPPPAKAPKPPTASS